MSLLLLFTGGTPPPSYPGGTLRRWNGNAWVKAGLKTWLAGIWQTKAMKRWTGSAWQPVDTTGI